MKLLLVIRALAVATAIVCALLSLVSVIPNGGRLRTISRLALVGAIGSHLAIEIHHVLGRRARWTKVIFPLVGLVAAVHAFALHRLPALTIGAALLVEFSVLAFGAAMVVRAIRTTPQSYPEDVVEDQLEHFSPRPFNRFLAVEMTIVLSAIAFVCGGFLRPLPDGFSYIRRWASAPLLAAFPAMILPEALVIDFIMWQAHAPPAWRIINAVVHLYGLLWIVGTLATARTRPHRIDLARARFRFGVLKKVDVERANIANVRVCAPVVNLRAFVRSFPRDGSTLVMALDGAPAVELALREPMPMRGMFGQRRSIQRVVVAVDEPYALAAALA